MKTKQRKSKYNFATMLAGFCLSAILCVNVQAQKCSGKLADNPQWDKQEMLKKASEEGNLELIKKLVEEKGLDVNTILKGNHTMLMHAAWKGQSDLAFYLLEKGADVSISNNWQNTAFHDAVIKGHLDIAKAIYEKGADINQGGNYDFTPLHMACQNQHAEIVKFLLEKGADIDKEDKDGRPAIMISSWNGNAEIMKVLIENGADVNFKTEQNNSILHNLARGGYLKATKLVLWNKGDANVLDNENMLPIQYAAQKQKRKMVSILAAKTKNINNTEKHSANSALHLAALNGDEVTAKILIENGANPRLENADGKTPIALAAEYAHVDLVQYFIDEANAGKWAMNLALKNKDIINQPVSDGKARVVYSGHSGWIIQTSDKVLVFDYWNNNKPKQGCLANGTFCPEEMKGKEVYVFASHAHGDHYDTIIHTWASEVKDIHYIYGFNPADAWINKKNGYKGPEFTCIENNKTQNVADVVVTTLKSNDSGQGFLVIADGVSIYHPGDHAWFSAEDEDIFKKEVDFVSSVNKQIDIAFLPVTGCPSRWKKEFIVQGFNYSIEQLNPTEIYPMHALNREYMLKEFEELAVLKSNRSKILCAENCGDKFSSTEVATASR